MQKLDLSLDIPGAPFVRIVRSEPEVEIDLDRPEFLDAPGGQALAVTPRPRHDERPTPSCDASSVHQQVMEALALLNQPDTLEVGPAATLIGDLNCKSIRIRGELSGALVASSVVLLEQESVLRGVIGDSEVVIVAGTVAGEPNTLAIRCNGLVVLTSSARVVGHIQCQSVAIYEGARLVGTIQARTGS